MKMLDIEPGMVCIGGALQLREVVSIDADTMVYRQIGGPPVTNGAVLPAGATRRVSLETFARWATREIQECPLLAASRTQGKRDGAA